MTSVRQKASIKTTSSLPYMELSATHRWVLPIKAKPQKKRDERHIDGQSRRGPTAVRRLCGSTTPTDMQDDNNICRVAARSFSFPGHHLLQ